MPRQIKRVKPLIYVFYEGESEQQYIDYLKNQFSDVAVIKRCAKYSLQGTTQGRYLTGGVSPVRFSM